ncbi:hypothetical protein Emag_000700 [Eimeria magna]
MDLSDDGSPKAQRGAVVFGWEHSAPLVHPSDCKETSSLRSGVSFPEPNCSHADICSPLVDCDYPNSWSIDMPSLGSYYVTVEVGSPCGDVRLTNLLVNEVPFINNELLHAGQYTKAVGRVTLFSSPTIKLTSDTRVTLQAVVIRKIKTGHAKEGPEHQHHAPTPEQPPPITPTKCTSTKSIDWVKEIVLDSSLDGLLRPPEAARRRRSSNLDDAAEFLCQPFSLSSCFCFLALQKQKWCIPTFISIDLWKRKNLSAAAAPPAIGGSNNTSRQGSRSSSSCSSSSNKRACACVIKSPVSPSRVALPACFHRLSRLPFIQERLSMLLLAVENQSAAALDPEGLFGSFVHPGPTPGGSNTAAAAAAAAAAGRSPATMQLQTGGLTGPFLLPEGWGFTGILLAPRRPRQEGPLLQQQKQLQQQQQQQLQQQKQLQQQRQLQRHQQIQQFALLAANRLNFPLACNHRQQLLQAKAKSQQPIQQQQQQQHVLLQHKIRVQQHMQMRQQQQLQQQQLQQQKIQQHQVQQQQLEQRQLHQQHVGQQQLQQKQQQQHTSQQQQRNQQQQQFLQQQQRLQQPQQACKQRPAQQQQQQQQKSQLMQQQYSRQSTIDQQQQQQQQQQPVDRQQMILLQGRETGAERTDRPQAERACARLSRVPTGHEETVPHQQQQQQQQLGTDVDYMGPIAMQRPQQQQQQNDEKQREGAQQRQQQQQQDSPLQRLQEHLDRHLQELQQQQQQQQQHEDVLSEASGEEKPGVGCAKDQSFLRRRSKCSNSSTATSPRSRSSSSSCNSSTSSCSSRSPPASAESTLIIIDYDDTLLPTNWVAVQHRVGLGDPVPDALQRELQQLTACIHETVSLCLSAGKVVLVTNASLEWVSRSGEKYIPGVWQLLLQQQIEIISARDRLQHHGIPQRLWKTHVFSEIVGDTLGPLAAAGEPCCLISIGDGEGEREACMQLCRSLPGKGWLFKSLKLLMQPSCSQLTSQHLLLQQAFKDILLVQQSLDMTILDYQLAALEETGSLKPLEGTESGGGPPSGDELSVGGPHEGPPLGTAPLPVLLAQEQGQKQQLLQQQQQQQQQAALAKQTAFILKNQGSVLGSTSKEKGLLWGASCSYRAAAAAAAPPKVPCYPLLNAADQHEFSCGEDTAEEETPVGQQLHQSLPTSPCEAAAAAAAAEAAAANTDAFIDLISAQLASQHLGPPSPPTKGPPDLPTCRRAGRGPQEGAPTTKLLSALEQN